MSPKIETVKINKVKWNYHWVTLKIGKIHGISFYYKLPHRLPHDFIKAMFRWNGVCYFLPIPMFGMPPKIEKFTAKIRFWEANLLADKSFPKSSLCSKNSGLQHKYSKIEFLLSTRMAWLLMMRQKFEIHWTFDTK